MRLTYRFLAVWLALTLTFILLRVLPGDAITSQLIEIGADPAVIEARRRELGLDQPLLIQYGEYFTRMMTGDWGKSLTRGVAVSTLIGDALPHTLLLALVSLLFATALGLMLGIIAGLNIVAGSAWIARFITALSISIPIYGSATLGIFFFSVYLNWLPASGIGGVEHIILPVALLSFHSSGAIARTTYSSIHQTLLMDYVQTAYAKGLQSHYILTQHILRASLPPVIIVVALQAGFLLGGTVIIERIFVRPGLGRVLLDATLSRDYPVVQAVVVLSALTYTALNILADLVHLLLDPRLRFKTL